MPACRWMFFYIFGHFRDFVRHRWESKKKVMLVLDPDPPLVSAIKIFSAEYMKRTGQEALSYAATPDGKALMRSAATRVCPHQAGL